MEFFRSFLRVIGLLEPAKVDFISELPPEVSQLILRKLDPESLLCAAQVSSKWLNVCRSDKILRRIAKHHKRRTEKRRREVVFGRDPTTPRRISVTEGIPESKILRRNIPIAKFEAAVMFGRDKRSRQSFRHSTLRASLHGTQSSCIRI